MTTPDNGTTTPEPTTTVLPASALEAPAAQHTEDPRIGQIETQLAALEKLATDAETGSRRRAYQEEISKLQHERSLLQLKPVLDAAEQETEAPAEPAPDFAKEGGYALQVPSYVPQSEVTEHAQGIVGEYGVLARELQIAPDAAQQLLETFVDARLSLPQGMFPGANPNECTSILRRTWGDQYAHNLKLVQDTTRALGPKFIAWADRDLGDGSKLSNDPAFCQALLAHAKGYTRLSPVQAQAALDKVMKDHKHPYWTGDGNAVAEVKALRARVSGTAGKANAKPTVKASAVPTERQQIEHRVAAIRRDPHYVGSDKALRQVLIAEMQQLQQQLSAEKKA